VVTLVHAVEEAEDLKISSRFSHSTIDLIVELFPTPILPINKI
jgi:hypothetical protein